MNPSHSFHTRSAREDDIPAIRNLMALAIDRNMRPFLSADEITAAKDTMGVDQTLLADQTYYVIETRSNDHTLMIGCGGWGKRKTLYGGDHTAGRDDRLSDPQTEAARIRAMYTHPDWIRRGVGSLLLQLGESAARNAGFRTIELGSTIAGEPFYLARGYREVSREIHIADNGARNVVIKMTKPL